jgi:hypothetical protein
MDVSFSKVFDESYLRELRRSDLEIVADMIARDIKVACILPKQQRMAVSNYIRDLADILDQFEE